MKRGLQSGIFRKQGWGFSPLTDDELFEIHMGTLDVLKNYGILMEDDEALEIMEEAGAIADRKTRLVKIPPSLVEDAISSAPSTVLLAGRTPEDDFVVQGGHEKTLSALLPLPGRTLSTGWECWS